MRLVFSVSRPYPRQCFQRPSILRPSCGNRAIRQKIRIKRSFCIQASSEIPQSGSSMSAELISSMKNKIQEALEAEKVEVVDVEGDGRHVTIDVIASAFEGKTPVLFFLAFLSKRSLY